MVLLAKFLLLLFMIIVVHGNIVVDVEQKVNIDGCCNGCCPCNSCEPVEYKCNCKDGIDGKCRQECQLDEIDMGECEDTIGEDCNSKCCVKDPCWGFPKYDLETCTIDICLPNGTIIEEKPYGDRTGCCLNPINDKMVPPGTEVDIGGCVMEICINSTWLPITTSILERCVKCWPWGEPHFRAFSGATFDWHVPCKHALAQEGFSMNPDFGVFMTFEELEQDTPSPSPRFSMIGPTIYKEGDIEVELDPNNRDAVKVGPLSTTITTSFPPTQFKGSLGTIYAWKKTKYGCIWMYGTSKILIELCKWQITIRAPEWNSHVFGWPGGYPQLGGLCSTNNLDKTLVARNRTAYPPPNANAVDISEGNLKANNFAECNEDFGLSWQTNWGQLPGCPELTNTYGRKKRDAADPRTVCSDVTISPYHEECLEIIQNSTLTGPVADMFSETCTFDLCIVDKFVNSTILTKEEMVGGYKQITTQAKTQEDITIGRCEIFEGVRVGGICLKFHHRDEKLNWTMAKDSCAASKPGSWSLAILDPNSVAIAVEDYTMKHFKGMIFYAGGYRHAGDSEIWKWLNGKNFQKHFPWYHGEPNNAGGKEDCLAIYPYGYNDCECHKPEHYICELDLE